MQLYGAAVRANWPYISVDGSSEGTDAAQEPSRTCELNDSTFLYSR